MSMRSNWCEFDSETRKYIKKRDNNRCIYCGYKGALQIAHIFVSRAHGGKGCKENGVLLCVNCHQCLDNPIGKTQKEKSKMIDDYCRGYLMAKEHIITTKEFLDTLIYKKDSTLTTTPFNNKNVSEGLKIIKNDNICKNCRWCTLKRIHNSSLNIYYCKYHQDRVSKNKTCKDFKRR